MENPQIPDYSDSSFWDKLKNFALKAGGEVIEKALQLIFQGEINHYRFDSASKTILPSDYT